MKAPVPEHSMWPVSAARGPFVDGQRPVVSRVKQKKYQDSEAMFPLTQI